MSEGRMHFMGGVYAGLRASFRVSEADRRARLGAFRRMIINFTKISGALFGAWLFAMAVDFPLLDSADFAEKAIWFTVLFWSSGLFLFMLFARLELRKNDKHGIVVVTHPAGRWGGWLYMAGAASLAIGGAEPLGYLMLDFLYE